MLQSEPPNSSNPAPLDGQYVNALLALRKFSESPMENESSEPRAKATRSRPLTTASNVELKSNRSKQNVRSEANPRKLSHVNSPVANSRKSVMSTTDNRVFAELRGNNWKYNLKQLSIIIGRKSGSSEDIDVDLGPSKVISRRHAKIEYNRETNEWELMCLGKNPIVVNGTTLGNDIRKITLTSK